MWELPQPHEHKQEQAQLLLTTGASSTAMKRFILPQEKKARRSLQSGADEAQPRLASCGTDEENTQAQQEQAQLRASTNTEVSQRREKMVPAEEGRWQNLAQPRTLALEIRNP